MSVFTPKVIELAKKHARSEYPMESCGVVINGDYLPVRNVAEDPFTSFQIPLKVQVALKGQIQAVIHSHPEGPIYPSRPDMEGQIASGVPWAIIALDEERVGEPVMWGDTLPIQPLIGREFIHGVADCYSTMRDAFRLGKDALERQGVTGWPLAPVTLPEVPRDDAWWSKGGDLYMDHFQSFGFRKITADEARGGDVFLFKIKSQTFNHAGVLLDGGLIVHHLPNRLSRREPASTWARAAEFWMRHETADAA